jgi:hypothetical protein
MPLSEDGGEVIKRSVERIPQYGETVVFPFGIAFKYFSFVKNS